MERLNQENIFCGAGSLIKSSLHNPLGRRLYPVGLSFWGIKRTYVFPNPPNFFQKPMFNESSRKIKSLQLISQYSQRTLFLRTMGNAFCWNLQELAPDVLQQNWLIFKYPFIRAGHLRTNVFDYGFGTFRWVCSQGQAVGFEENQSNWLLKFWRLWLILQNKIIRQQMQEIIITDRRGKRKQTGLWVPRQESSMQIAGRPGKKLQRHSIKQCQIWRNHGSNRPRTRSSRCQRDRLPIPEKQVNIYEMEVNHCRHVAISKMWLAIVSVCNFGIHSQTVAE